MRTTITIDRNFIHRELRYYDYSFRTLEDQEKFELFLVDSANFHNVNPHRMNYLSSDLIRHAYDMFIHGKRCFGCKWTSGYDYGHVLKYIRREFDRNYIKYDSVFTVTNGLYRNVLIGVAIGDTKFVYDVESCIVVECPYKNGDCLVEIVNPRSFAEVSVDYFVKNCVLLNEEAMVSKWRKFLS